MPGKYEITQGKNKQFHFHLLAPNGEVVLSSQMYNSKAGAKNGIKAVQADAGDANRYDRRKDKRGQNYFVLKAGNHQIIGTSEGYSSAAAMEKGIKSMMKNGVGGKVSDET